VLIIVIPRRNDEESALNQTLQKADFSHSLEMTECKAFDFLISAIATRKEREKMRFELDFYTRDLPNEWLIEDLKRVAKLIGKESITTTEYRAHSKCNPGLFTSRFGSWRNALQEAGLKPATNQGLIITDEDYFNNLKEVWIKLGRQPKYDEMRSPLSRYRAESYAGRFGSWRKALIAFVEYANSKSTDDE
jgi:hypothetical protein